MRILNLLLRFNKRRLLFTGCCRCIKCSKELSTGLGMIKCKNCGEMQPPPPTQATPTCCPNYYGLLVPDSPTRPLFGIDLRALKGEYLKLQAQVHPDKMRGVVGASWSSWINRANETLRNPLQRAIYLLNLKTESVNMQDLDNESVIDNDNDNDNISDSQSPDSHSSDSQSSDTPDNHDISLVLEVREAISETNCPSELSTLKQQNDARIEDCCRELEGLFDGSRNDFERVKRCINRLRYWMSIDDELKKRL